MNELADIVEPVQVTAAASQYGYSIVAGLVLAIGALAVMRWWLRSKPRRHALRRLRKFRHDVGAGRMTPRELGYAIASELRDCLQTHRLRTACPVASGEEARQAAWQRFVARLDSLRYQPGSGLDPAQADALLREAAVWARRASRC